MLPYDSQNIEALAWERLTAHAKLLNELRTRKRGGHGCEPDNSA
jgi:hypothetical protein